MRQVSFLCILVLLLSQASCAVVKASKSSGTDIKDFLQSETRGSVLSHDGVEILQTERDENGVIISEDYFVQKKKGSMFRAIMHGVLDLATLGAWEIIGTPVEMSKEGKEGVAVRVFYTDDGKTTKMEFKNLLFFSSQKRELYQG